MINKTCPISSVLVDANVVRVNALYVGTFFSLYLVLKNDFIIYFLIVDFMIRLFLKNEYSPMFFLSRNTKVFFKIKSDFVDAAPKRLASLFGLSFLILIACMNFFGFIFFFYLLSAILLICITLEVIFSYCLGCEIYYLYQKIFV